MVYVGAIFIILGAVIHFAKAYDLIAGVNTMSKEEKEKTDLEGIGKLFWQVMLTMGILFILCLQTVMENIIFMIQLLTEIFFH